MNFFQNTFCHINYFLYDDILSKFVEWQNTVYRYIDLKNKYFSRFTKIQNILILVRLFSFILFVIFSGVLLRMDMESRLMYRTHVIEIISRINEIVRF